MDRDLLASQSSQRAQAQSKDASPRETLLADFAWRFHLGHANDPAQDFGYGQGRMFDKVGRLLAISRASFDDGGWCPIDLPHDWAIELPFENRSGFVRSAGIRTRASF